MIAFVGVDLEKPRPTNYWSPLRDNVPRTDCESYYCRSIVILVMDNLINNLEDRTVDRKYKDGQIQPTN